MRKLTKHAPLHEALRNLWKIRIMLEKSYTETCATWMAQRIESLIDHMQYGHALIAYHTQAGRDIQAGESHPTALQGRLQKRL